MVWLLVKQIMGIELQIYFMAGSLFCLMYGIKWHKHDEGRKIRFPITLSIFLFLYAAFGYFDFVTGRIIIAFPMSILLFGNRLLGKILDRKIKS